MNKKAPKYLSIEECVDHIVDMYGNDIKIGMPLGLGKPIRLINALYQHAKKNPQINLTIFTALSFEKPIPSSDLEKRLIGPFAERTWKDVPDIDFLFDLRSEEGLPKNIRIFEMYSKAGTYKGIPHMQQNHLSTNYTHTVRDIEVYNNRIFAHTVAKSEIDGDLKYSCSCNSDTALETFDRFHEQQEQGEKQLIIGVVNTKLPFMYGDAVVSPENYDIIIDDPADYHPLFATPRAPVSIPDFMIGLHISALIKDNGTLQIGIGALGDSIAYGLNVRHNENEAYKKLIKDSGISDRYKTLIGDIGGTDTFEEGLYGSTEMLVDGFLQLYKNGVIKRKIYHHIGIQKLINDGKLKEEIPADILKLMIEDETIHPYLTQKDFDSLQRFGVIKEDITYDNGELVNGNNRYSALLADDANLAAISENCLGTKLKNGVMLTGGFFLGPQDFYDDLNNMPEEERKQFEMTGVDVANQLYGNEVLRTLQRKDGRFCNTGMKATIMGAICSDGLEDGTVISGVGGQYNFVSMAHALPDGRCLMMIKSTKVEGTKTVSNIVYNYGHTTIPRHLKDIVVTEYGIADIRGKCDQDIIKEMLNVTDSRFQEELMAEAKKNQKLPEDYQIPEEFKNNTPEKLVQTLADPKAKGLFPDFPCGAPMTPEELFIAFSLKTLAAKAQTPQAAEFPKMMGELPTEIPDTIKPLVARMGLETPTSKEEIISQKTFLLALKLAGFF